MKAYLKNFANKASYTLNAMIFIAAGIFFLMQPEGAIGFQRTLGFGIGDVASKLPVKVAQSDLTPPKQFQRHDPLPAEKPPVPTSTVVR